MELKENVNEDFLEDNYSDDLMVIAPEAKDEASLTADQKAMIHSFMSRLHWYAFDMS